MHHPHVHPHAHPHARHGHHPCPMPIPEGVDADSAAVLNAFRRATRLNRQMLARTMSDAGGHPGQAGCLRILAAHDVMTQRDLAGALFISPAALTTMLQRMERQGLVERWPDEDDQRLMRIRLTEAGRGSVDTHAAAFADYVRATVGSLTKADRRELARLLDALGDNVAARLAEPGEASGEGSE